MPRPHRGRWVGCNPGVTFFKPAGVPASALRVCRVDLDELEAMRLVDEEGLHQTQAAERMKVSQSTVARLLEAGRRKVTRALVHGEALEIQQGEAPINFHMPSTGPLGSGGRGRGRHGRRGRGYGAGNEN